MTAPERLVGIASNREFSVSNQRPVVMAARGVKRQYSLPAILTQPDSGIHGFRYPIDHDQLCMPLGLRLAFRLAVMPAGRA
jgi:hypothetical protein